MEYLKPTIVSVIMGILLIIDEVFALNYRNTFSEEYVAMAIAVVWPALIWLTTRRSTGTS